MLDLGAEQEVFFRQELLRLRKEHDVSDDVFYHYDTPLTVEHEKEVRLMGNDYRNRKTAPSPIPGARC